jgi:hypothetical protein
LTALPRVGQVKHPRRGRPRIELNDPDVGMLPERFVRSYADLLAALYGSAGCRSIVLIPPGRGKPVRESGFKDIGRYLDAKAEADEVMERCADELHACEVYALRTLKRVVERLEREGIRLEDLLDGG